MASSDGRDGLTTPHGEPIGPDPHGQAALLLVESLVHVLIEKQLLTHMDALDAVQTAIDVETEIALAETEPRKVALASLCLLKKVGLSFQAQAMVDGGDGAGLPRGGDGHGLHPHDY